jgi:hypothetical protein
MSLLCNINDKVRVYRLGSVYHYATGIVLDKEENKITVLMDDENIGLIEVVQEELILLEE